MKKSVCFVLIIQLMFTACMNNSSDASGSFDAFLEKWDELSSYPNVCTSVADAFIFPENWTREDLDNFANLPDAIFCSMSTCGLLKTLLEHPTNRMTGPWCFYCNSNDLPGVTMFNNKLRSDKVVVELFERDDCFSVLASKYLTIIKEKKEIDFQIRYFEMLLASDMCMTALNEKEKIMLMAMAMALGKKGYDTDFLSSTPYIMIAIMRACNYTPFINEVSSNLVECTWGYCNINEYDILKYAERFLNEKK